MLGVETANKSLWGAGMRQKVGLFLNKCAIFTNSGLRGSYDGAAERRDSSLKIAFVPGEFYFYELWAPRVTAPRSGGTAP